MGSDGFSTAGTSPEHSGNGWLTWANPDISRKCYEGAGRNSSRKFLDFSREVKNNEIVASHPSMIDVAIGTTINTMSEVSSEELCDLSCNLPHT